MTENIKAQYASFFFYKTDGNDIGTISINAPDGTTININRFDNCILFSAGFKNEGEDVPPYSSIIISFRHGDDNVTITFTYSVDAFPDVETLTRTYIHIVEQNDIRTRHTSHVIGKNGWAVDGGIHTEVIEKVAAV